MPKDFFVGVLHFNESFSLELIERLNRLDAMRDRDGNMVKINASSVLIHEISIDYHTPYNLIIDRGSHLVKHAIGVFMIYAFRGVHFINNPLSFHYFIDHKDVGFALALSLGIRVPKTYILPAHTNNELERDDFGNHRLFDWDHMADQIGWPCYIKPAEGRGAFGVHKVYSLQQLWDCYNSSGEKIMTIQADVDSPHPWHVRCLCIGRRIIPIKFIFRPNDCSEYILDDDFLAPWQREKIIYSSRIINRIFGYEMNSVEFILDHRGEPWAIDFNNPIPDSRHQALGPVFYREYMEAMIQRTVEIARWRPQTLFLPAINEFSAIAQADMTKSEKFVAALEIANRFYEV